MALGGLAAMVLAAIQLRQQLRPHVAIQPEYLVASADMAITPPPAWIHSDVKATAIRDAALPSKLSILDDRLSERISQACLLNPWIARVEKVQTLYPARIQVNLIYRRPVAMIEVFGGLLPVDSDAVLLPTEDFRPRRRNTIRASRAFNRARWDRWALRGAIPSSRPAPSWQICWPACGTI